MGGGKEQAVVESQRRLLRNDPISLGTLLGGGWMGLKRNADLAGKG